MPSPDPSRVAAELDVIADTIERQRERVGELAHPFLGTDRDDIVATVHEAERQLLMATRALRRALRTLQD
ncbi:MAG: hypothetical protein ACLGHQ_04605 [Acidimicrobiia bacterium]